MRSLITLVCFVVAAVLLVFPLTYAAMTAFQGGGPFEFMGIRVDNSWLWFLAGALLAMVIGAAVALTARRRA